jgi:hypothetical protein
MNRKTLSNILTLLGVLAWVPFLYLVAKGQEPSIFPYLTVHLTGVIGGTQLRRDSSPSTKVRSRRQSIGRILILLGIFAWAPYLYQKEILAQSIEMAPYLTAHLTGLLGGIALLLSVPLTQYMQRRRQPADQIADELDPTL